jgi:succinoglycan biosynthesis transport protein ExoP
MEKVLLIDGDMRKPTIAKVLIYRPIVLGYRMLLPQRLRLDDCILHMEDANIDVLTAGLVPPNPLELLSSQKFAELIRSLSETYDRIIIDSPPTLLVSDSLIMSKVRTCCVVCDSF